MPQIQVNGDTSYLLGIDGVESRGVQWLQPLFLGRSLNGPVEVRGGVGFTISDGLPGAP